MGVTRKRKKPAPSKSSAPRETDPGPLEGGEWFILVDMMHESIDPAPEGIVGFLPVYKTMDDATRASNGRGELIRIRRRKDDK